MSSSSFAPRIVGLLFFLLAAGCVREESAPPREPPVTGATQGGAIGVEPSVAKIESPSARTPAKIPASPSAAEQPRKKESAAPSPSKQEVAPSLLDLRSLEQRLRDTKAIGVFTKISLKNQVEDLLTQFRAFHQGQAGVILAELRERYNLLLLKVLSLLQGDDPALAQAVAASREAIWGILADPVKFATL
jgi:hypothetical protein